MINLNNNLSNSKKQNKEIKHIINKLLPEFDEYNLSKIKIFARILSIDNIIDSSELYEKNWGEEFKKYIKIILNQILQFKKFL